MENNFPIDTGKSVKQTVKHFSSSPSNCIKKFNNLITKPAIDHIWLWTVRFNLLNKIIRKDIKTYNRGIGHWLFLPHLPHLPSPTPQLKDILKTLLANYALDKLKIEIAGIFTPSVPLPYPLGRTAPEVKRIFALTGSLCED